MNRRLQHVWVAWVDSSNGAAAVPRQLNFITREVTAGASRCYRAPAFSVSSSLLVSPSVITMSVLKRK